MKNRKAAFEKLVYGIFLLLGLVTVGCVLLITVYLVIAGLPAIREIGLVQFLFGRVWASTAAEPSYGILPFILTSVYGTAGAIVIGVPVGFLTAVYLAKLAPKGVKSAVGTAVSLLAGIPSVVYGLVGMIVLVPAIREAFRLPDGASLFAAILVLAVMILPSIVKVSVTALEAVPKEYEDASLSLGATPVETYFRVSVPAAKKRHCRRRGAGRRQGHWRGYGGYDGLRECGEYALSVRQRALSYNGCGNRDVLFLRSATAGAVFHCSGAVPLYHAD